MTIILDKASKARWNTQRLVEKTMLTGEPSKVLTIRNIVAASGEIGVNPGSRIKSPSLDIAYLTYAIQIAYVLAAYKLAE